jgi:hypothetical protein
MSRRIRGFTLIEVLVALAYRRRCVGRRPPGQRRPHQQCAAPGDVLLAHLCAENELVA